MQIERTDEEILIRLSAKTDITGLERILEFLKIREITSQSTAKQKDIDELAKESKSRWWEENKGRFLK